MQKVYNDNPGKVIKKAVDNMLPKTRHRKEMLKRLFIITINLCFLCFTKTLFAQRISVTGVAKNAKNIATVVSKTQQYFLNGVYQWDTNYLDKKVRVTGILFISKYKKDTLNPIEFAQRHNVDMYYLLKSKWKLVK